MTCSVHKKYIQQMLSLKYQVRGEIGAVSEPRIVPALNLGSIKRIFTRNLPKTGAVG